jgi:hypothetical protein
VGIKDSSSDQNECPMAKQQTNLMLAWHKQPNYFALKIMLWHCLKIIVNGRANCFGEGIHKIIFIIFYFQAVSKGCLLYVHPICETALDISELNIHIKDQK